ncbi:MAG: pyridoxal-5'-phosphate-dependent protein [Phenylobacterium zucineum]|nr:MAG: pyridoxal-5'-phosphate-dependent protein [Phenylobacterium zucineum]
MSVSFTDIERAAQRLAGLAVRTPLIESDVLNDLLGLRVLIKPETLQRVGAFKFRGAYNRLSQIPPKAKAAGVVAFSSGNHAQGVALAARMLGMPALIVMPSDAPKIKVDATLGYGAEIAFYNRMTDDRIAMAAAFAEQRGAIIVPAFDDDDIIAGQGTVGLEMVQQAADLNLKLDMVISPVGGGGLLAGTALAVKARSPGTLMVGVEPVTFNDTKISLEAGVRQAISPSARSLCDALESPAPGALTFPIVQQTVTEIAVVSDAEVAAAMRYAFSTLKLVVEPGGVVGLAALLAGKVASLTPRQVVGVVLSGGNVDPDLFAQVLRGDY